MKLVKTSSGNKLKISRKEWEALGEKAGWTVSAKKKKKMYETQPKDPKDQPKEKEWVDPTKGIRKQMPPPGRFHSTPKGKKGYDRKDKRWKEE